MSETRKMAAILAADVVGFSRLAGADEDRTLARLRSLRSDLIDPTIAVHHGRVVKRTGDGLLVEFRSVVDAVRCAIEIQSAMLDRNAGVPVDRRIEFRIGIHLGDVVEESDGDLMGDGVNIASRLEGVAKPGAICLSEDAYRYVKGRLDLAAIDLGPIELKNIAEPVRAYSLQAEGPGQARSGAAAQPATRPGLIASNKRWPMAPAVAGLVALLVVIVAGVSYLAGVRPAALALRSIVVLPFVNLSGDAGQDYLVDALTDELTTDLARIGGAFVIARNTAFTYKGKPTDAKQIGKDLGVRYVLEGSVESSGAQVRVNAQLISADSGAHLWADQFDTPRVDLLQTQDEIVTHLTRALDLQLTDAEAARIKRTRAANPDAEDLALQCAAGVRKGGYVGKEADAGYHLCERALDGDANNVHALSWLSVKYWLPAGAGFSADPKADLERANQLVSKALALDPNSVHAHASKANILTAETRYEEAIMESERSLSLDPANADVVANVGFAYLYLGQFERSLEYFDKAMRLSPHDPNPGFWDSGKAEDYFGLKKYDKAIEDARRAIAVNPGFPPATARLVAALALTGREADAREELQRYLAMGPAGLATIAAWKAYFVQRANDHVDPRYVEYGNRLIDGLRKAGMPET